MYVSNSDKDDPVWNIFDVNDDGSLSNVKIFYNSAHLLQANPSLGNPDGFKVDMNGNLIASGPGGVLVISPNGELLGRIVLDRYPIF